MFFRKDPNRKYKIRLSKIKIPDSVRKEDATESDKIYLTKYNVLIRGYAAYEKARQNGAKKVPVYYPTCDQCRNPYCQFKGTMCTRFMEETD